MQRIISVRKKALPEIMQWCEKREAESNNGNDMVQMILLFKNINHLINSENGGRLILQSQNIGDYDSFANHVNTFLLYHDDDDNHLPISVFSFIVPTMSTSFILHIMLSMGRFETELDLTIHSSLKQYLRYCGLIGPNDDELSLFPIMLMT